jgi:hypothetical protein
VFERSVTIHQLKARILDLEKVTNGASAGPNSARVQLEGVQLKLVNANNQVDGLRAELQRVIKQRDVQMEKADADAKVLHDQVRRGYIYSHCISALRSRLSPRAKKPTMLCPYIHTMHAQDLHLHTLFCNTKTCASFVYAY